MPRNPYTCVNKCLCISQQLADENHYYVCMRECFQARVIIIIIIIVTLQHIKRRDVRGKIIAIGAVEAGAAFTATGGLAPLGVSLLASGFAGTVLGTTVLAP